MAFKSFDNTALTGEMRHLINLVQPNTTGARDAGGVLLPSTTLASNVFAAFVVWGKSPAKTTNAGHGEVDVSNFRFTIRTIPGVTLPLQIIFNGLTYKAYSVIDNPEAPGFELWLFAQQVDNA